MDPTLDEFTKIQNKFGDIFNSNWDFISSVVKTRCLIELNRDLLFAWNSEESNIFVVNVAVLAGKDSEKCYQCLELSAPPDFAVERLRVNDTGTHVALMGPRGACIVQLPARWGSAGLFKDGRDAVLCKSCSVETSLFLRVPSLEILELRWCPPPLPDYLFIVLVSNNQLRLYNAAEADTTLQEWRVGRPLGRGQLMDPVPTAERRLLPLLAALGDTAVSFDFLPPVSWSSLRVRNTTGDMSHSQHQDRAWVSSTPVPPRGPETSSHEGDTEQSSNDDVCSIAVLFGQGDIYILVPPFFNSFLAQSERAALFGPLWMKPCPYGLASDNCSLICLQVEPPLLVIASAIGGRTYHGLLINQPANMNLNISGVESETDSVVGAEECGKFIRIIEQVNLNIGMGVGEVDADTSNDDSAFTCPMVLTSDPSSPSRYFCSHEAGVHSVTLPLVQELQKFNANQCTLQEAMKALPSNGVLSHIHYLLCTQLGNSQSPQPLQGFTSIPLTLAALALLPRPVLVPLPSLAMPPMSKSIFSESLHILEWKELTQSTKHESHFEEKIRSLLQHNCTQPLLKLPPTAKLSNRDILDLLNKSVAVLREEYLAKLNLVHEEMKHKSVLLEKTQQVRMRQIADLRAMIQEYEDRRYVLREKMEIHRELANDNRVRLMEIVRKQRLSQPEMSDAEIQLSRNMERNKLKLEKFKETIDAINNRVKSFQEKQDENLDQSTIESEYLSDKEVREYMSSLAETSQRIKSLSSEINHLKGFLQRTKLHSIKVAKHGDATFTSP